MCPITGIAVSDSVSSVPEALSTGVRKQAVAVPIAYSGGNWAGDHTVRGTVMGERSKGKDKGKAKKAQKAAKPDKRPHVQQKEQQDATRPPV